MNNIGQTVKSADQEQGQFWERLASICRQLFHHFQGRRTPQLTHSQALANDVGIGETLARGYFIPAIAEIYLGGVNRDGNNNLLDVGPFIDGVVNLLDVDQMIVILGG